VSLDAARAIVVGVGARGGPVATYLAASGVGTIGLVDPDAEVAAARVGLVNAEIVAEPYPVSLEESNAEAIVMGADVVVDCTAGDESRYLVNDACCGQAVALVEGAVDGYEAVVLSVRPGSSACWRCAFPEPPGTGDRQGIPDSGVTGTFAGMVGSIQALEALKLVAGVGEPLLDRILRIDGHGMGQAIAATARRDGCPACARVPSS
jgi:adenylyltransferase/sulfurtransferase